MRAPFDQHRAGAALAVIAALLRAGQREMFAQSVEQRRAGIQHQGMEIAVDPKLDLHGGRGRLAAIERTRRKGCMR